MKFQVRVTGHKELRKAVRETRDKGLARGLRQAHKETADLVVPAARVAAPRASGALASTVAPSSSVKGAIVRAGLSKGRTRFYAGPIHFGWPTRRIAPRPFLFRAAYATRDQVAARFRDLISALVRDNIDS